MMENNEIKCSMIVVIVNKGFSETLMDVARANGATGGTILSGRGTGGEKAQKFFAMSLQEEKEVVLILVKEEIRADLMRTLAREFGLDSPGRGIVFSLPVEEAIGLTFVPFTE